MTPRPLWELVERWQTMVNGSYWDGDCLLCVDELAAVLRAWNEALSTAGQSTDPLQEHTIRKCHEYTRQQVLGVPPKEPETEKK